MRFKNPLFGSKRSTFGGFRTSPDSILATGLVVPDVILAPLLLRFKMVYECTKRSHISFFVSISSKCIFFRTKKTIF